MEDVLPLYGTESKSDVEAGELRGIQRLGFNKTLELLDPAIPEAKLPPFHLVHFESLLFFSLPSTKRHGYTQETFDGFCWEERRRCELSDLQMPFR